MKVREMPHPPQYNRNNRLKLRPRLLVKPPDIVVSYHQVVAGKGRLPSRSGPWSADPASSQQVPRTKTTMSRVKDRRPPSPPYVGTESTKRGSEHARRWRRGQAEGTQAPRRRPQEGDDARRRRRRDQMVKGFHPELWHGEATTMVPPRGTQHPHASSPLTRKRWAFARNHAPPCQGTTIIRSSTNQASMTRSGSRHCRSTTNTRNPHRSLHVVLTTQERSHHHRSAARRRARRAVSRAAAPASRLVTINQRPPQQAKRCDQGRQ
jgi:hypothetical protein